MKVDLLIVWCMLQKYCKSKCQNMSLRFHLKDSDIFFSVFYVYFPSDFLNVHVCYSIKIIMQCWLLYFNFWLLLSSIHRLLAVDFVCTVLLGQI